MKQIALSRGLVAWVDDDDYEELIHYKWHAVNGGHGSFYAARYDNRPDHPSQMLMQNQIMRPPEGLSVDHIDGDTLNNSRSNMRLATRSQQQANRRSFAGSTSKYKGVSWKTDRKMWRAVICLNGKYHYLGNFDIEEDAALAYNDAALMFHGEFAYLNVIKPPPKEK